MTREETREIDKQIAQVIADVVVSIDWESDDPKDDAVLAYLKCAKEIRTRLDKLGVAIKVGRELSAETLNDIYANADRYALRPNYADELNRKVLDKAGYGAFEPLIEKEA